MMIRKYKKIFREVFHIMGADKIIISYLIFFFIITIAILVVEPNITNFIDSLWFCFATASTIGYGDIIVISPISRILTIILSIYSIAVVSIFTAVITSYFLEQAKIRAKDSARKFIDNLHHLDELSKEELRELSKKIKEFDKYF